LAAILLALALALPTASYVGRAAVPRIGDPIARQIARIAAALPAPTASMVVETTIGIPAPLHDASPADPSPRPHPNGRTAPSAPKRSSIATIEIPAERLAPLTEKQLRGLRAVDAVDADGRALGATLSGVGALRLGLDDGDVVTSIDDRATPDVSSALAAAVKAYGSGRDTTRATVLRGGRTLFVLVHIPRPASGQKG
jgi:S1-C subfamily serine protease